MLLRFFSHDLHCRNFSQLSLFLFLPYFRGQCIFHGWEHLDVQSFWSSDQYFLPSTSKNSKRKKNFSVILLFYSHEFPAFLLETQSPTKTIFNIIMQSSWAVYFTMIFEFYICIGKWPIEAEPNSMCLQHRKKMLAALKCSLSPVTWHITSGVAWSS
jgi:hypothetical protein